MNQHLKKFLLPPYRALKIVQSFFFPTWKSKSAYKKRIGRKCNLKDPQALTEKLMYYKLNLYWNNDVVAALADKYKVRAYVEECGLGNTLNQIYCVWEKPSDIDFSSLPKSFVLKANTGSGFNLIIKDKDSICEEQIRKIIKKWFKVKYGYLYGEQGIYSKIKNKIIVEKYIEEFEKGSPDDYKFFCSYGEVKFLFNAAGRSENNTTFDFYTPSWDWIDVRNVFPNNPKKCAPKNFDKMMEYASILSKPFPLVRIDFYNIDGEIIFGEITFTHFGCLAPFEPDEYDFKFGKMFLPVSIANDIRL